MNELSQILAWMDGLAADLEYASDHAPGAHRGLTLIESALVRRLMGVIERGEYADFVDTRDGALLN